MTLRILEVAKTSLEVTGSIGKHDRKDGKAYEENFSRATTGRGKLFDFFLFTNLNIRPMTSTGDQTGGRQTICFFSSFIPKCTICCYDYDRIHGLGS